MSGSSLHYCDAFGWWRGDGEEPLGFVEEEVREHEGFVADVLPAETSGGVDEAGGVERFVFEVVPCVEGLEGGGVCA